jgi:hypothetical protein
MSIMMKIGIAALAIGAAALAGGAQAAAGPNPAAPAEAGTLNCTLDTNVGLVLGSVRKVDCQFERYDRRGRMVREGYVGLLKRAGLDLGIAGPQNVTFKVTTAGGRAQRGMLAGTFGGASAEATFIVGPGTRAMFGEDGDRIMLDPVAQSEQVGMRLGVGATEMELMPVTAAAYSSLR